MKKKIFSFDAETNGLWGQAFAIGAVVVTPDGQVETFLARCPIEGEVNEWVKNNVLPQLKDVPVTHNSYRDMLEDFSSFYMKHKEGSDIIVHVGLPVEARVLLDMHKYGFIGDWDAPFPLIDISAFSEIGTSVDAYIERNELSLEMIEGMNTHNPLYDSAVALLAYNHYLRM